MTKFNKEERKAIISKVSKIAKERYNKALEEAREAYIPSKKYLEVKKAIEDREAACNVLIKEAAVNSWKVEKIDQKVVLTRIMDKELNIPKYNIDETELETEIILSCCGSVDELIEKLLDLCMK